MSPIETSLIKLGELRPKPDRAELEIGKTMDFAQLLQDQQDDLPEEISLEPAISVPPLDDDHPQDPDFEIAPIAVAETSDSDAKSIKAEASVEAGPAPFDQSDESHLASGILAPKFTPVLPESTVGKFTVPGLEPQVINHLNTTPMAAETSVGLTTKSVETNVQLGRTPPISRTDRADTVASPLPLNPLPNEGAKDARSVPTLPNASSAIDRANLGDLGGVLPKSHSAPDIRQAANISPKNPDKNPEVSPTTKDNVVNKPTQKQAPSTTQFMAVTWPYPQQISTPLAANPSLLPSTPLFDDIAVMAPSATPPSQLQVSMQTPYPTAPSPQIAAQIAAAVTRSDSGTTEIRLNPEELGKVRIALNPTEAGLSVTVLAERPETADLLRRHIETLAQEFKQLGYENLAFDFGDSPDDNPETSSDEPAQKQTIAIGLPAVGELLQNNVLAHRGGLDLKL